MRGPSCQTCLATCVTPCASSACPNLYGCGGAYAGLGNRRDTAIFTLIHAVMLRSFAVADPGRLTGSVPATIAAWKRASDKWGMFSILVVRASEEEHLNLKKGCFPAGRWRVARGVKAFDSLARPLGRIRHRELFLDARGRRLRRTVFTAGRRQAVGAPVRCQHRLQTIYASVHQSGFPRSR